MNPDQPPIPIQRVGPDTGVLRTISVALGMLGVSWIVLTSLFGNDPAAPEPPPTTVATTSTTAPAAVEPIFIVSTRGRLLAPAELVQQAHDNPDPAALQARLDDLMSGTRADQP